MRRHGWTYTKVNRCIVEGRAALRALRPTGAACCRSLPR
jgi:hypothetical protein